MLPTPHNLTHTSPSFEIDGYCLTLRLVVPKPEFMSARDPNLRPHGCLAELETFDLSDVSDGIQNVNDAWPESDEEDNFF